MFIISVKGEKHIWNNELKDDFLQFLPEHFGCTPADIAAYYVAPSDAKALSRHLAADPGNGVDLTDPTRIVPVKVLPPALKVGDVDPDAPGSVIQEGDPRTQPQVVPAELPPIQTAPLAGWPYDEHGSFLGNKLAS